MEGSGQYVQDEGLERRLGSPSGLGPPVLGQRRASSLLRVDRHVDQAPKGGGVEKGDRSCPGPRTPYSARTRNPHGGGPG